MQYTLPLHGALPKMKDKGEKGAEDSICPTSCTIKDSYSFNLFQHVQPGFPLPAFHRGNKVDQSNHLAFSVFLQGMGCFVKTEAIRQRNNAVEKELFLPGVLVTSAHILSQEGSKPG